MSLVEMKIIILFFDELHDSSRCWIEESYIDRFNMMEPEKLIRIVLSWIKKIVIHVLIYRFPQHIIEKAYNSYNYFYENISKFDVASAPPKPQRPSS